MMQRFRLFSKFQRIANGSKLRDFGSASSHATSAPNGHHVNENDLSPDQFLLEVKSRRKEAQNSACIQLDINDSDEEIFSHISKFGPIKYMSSCSVAEKKKCLIVEYETSASIKELLHLCYNQGYNGGVPFYTNFLEYRQRKTQRVSEFQRSKIAFEETNAFDGITFKKLRDADSISDQIHTLYESQKLTEVEKRIRFLVCQQLEQSFSGIFPQSKVLPFGSSVNGFGKRRCDLDMIWQFYTTDQAQENNGILNFKSRNIEDRKEMQHTLFAVSTILQAFIPGISQVQNILHARVPIVKFNHSYVNLACDLSIVNLSGFYMSELLYLYSKYDARVKHLVFVIRRWAADNGLTFPFPGVTITNFSWLLMVIFFFQTKGTVSLAHMEHYLNKKTSTKSMAVSFADSDDKACGNQDYIDTPIGHLLLEFFEFYIKFDFNEKGICVLHGEELLKSGNDALYIKNPIDPELNVSKNVSFDQVQKIQECMRVSLMNLTSTDSSKDSSWGLCSIFENKSSSNEKVLDMPSMLAAANSTVNGSSHKERNLDQVNSSHDNVTHTSRTQSGRKDVPLNSFVDGVSSIYQKNFQRKRKGKE